MRFKWFVSWIRLQRNRQFHKAIQCYVEPRLDQLGRGNSIRTTQKTTATYMNTEFAIYWYTKLNDNDSCVLKFWFTATIIKVIQNKTISCIIFDRGNVIKHCCNDAFINYVTYSHIFKVNRNQFNRMYLIVGFLVIVFIIRFIFSRATSGCIIIRSLITNTDLRLLCDVVFARNIGKYQKEWFCQWFRYGLQWNSWAHNSDRYILVHFSIG